MHPDAGFGSQQGGGAHDAVYKCLMLSAGFVKNRLWLARRGVMAEEVNLGWVVFTAVTACTAGSFARWLPEEKGPMGKA